MLDRFFSYLISMLIGFYVGVRFVIELGFDSSWSSILGVVVGFAGLSLGAVMVYRALSIIRRGK